MNAYKTIMIILTSTLLFFIFIIWSSLGGYGAAGADQTTGGAVDVSPVPANSEFLKEESE